MIDARNDAAARESDRMRAYAADLEATSRAYVIAADAPGLRRDCARYLYSESLRLHRESGAAEDRADDLERSGR
jgi:hypothetical protein